MNDETRASRVERTEFFLLVTGNGEAVLTPPPPPAGYEPLSAVQPVSTAELSGYWACLAYHQQGVYGLLIYWRRNDIHAFYPTRDADHLLCLYGADWGLDLFGNCIQGEPGQDQLDINRLWSDKQRECVDQHPQAQGEEVQHAME